MRPPGAPQEKTGSTDIGSIPGGEATPLRSAGHSTTQRKMVREEGIGKAKRIKSRALVSSSVVLDPACHRAKEGHMCTTAQGGWPR